jgi:predicted ATPase/DNA-binding winged helix-turn-helix (wHTH) protein
MFRDAPLTVNGRAFDVLVALVRRQGALAGKQELLDEVWPGIAVEENNVTTQVLNLRKLLAAHDPQSTYIVTDAGRGYRFVAEVTVPDLVAPEPLPPGAASCEPAVPDLDGRGEPEDAPLPAAREPHNLPAELNSFIGRGAELAEIARRLQSTALLTLVGAGGVGKTRCAVRVGHSELADFADGVWLVELAPMHDGGLVAEAVCRAIGAPVSGERPALEVAAAFLRQRKLLLILDNCEHLLEAAGRLAATLARQCAGVKILATSRQALGVDGETVFRMPSLPVPAADAGISAAAALQSDAVRLFVDRANAASGGYRLTDEDAPSVVTICRRLDGVAMATELAAARLRMLKPAEIAARLEDVFRLLTGGNKAALPRQQTLRATIDWSFALLSPAEQIVLCRLSVFVDGFSLEGATAVAIGGPIDELDVLDLLQALVDKSLVNADTSGSVTRYRMLETTRHYAREKLAQGGRGRRFRRMAEYLARFYARAEETWCITPTDVWLAQFAPDVENLRAAIDWAFDQGHRVEDSGDERGDPALGIRLVAAAGSIAEEMSLQSDIRRWTATAVNHIGENTLPKHAAWIWFWIGENDATLGASGLSQVRQKTIELFRLANDALGLSRALRTSGISMARPGEHGRDALAMLTEAVALVRPIGQNKNLATALAHVGVFHYIDGDHALARSYTGQALEMRLALGDRTGVCASYLNMGEFAFALGNTAEAIEFAERAIDQSRRHGLLDILGTSLSNLANYRLAIDDLAGARRDACEGLTLLRAVGNANYAVLCLENIALERVLSGDAIAAARLFGFISAYFTRTGQVREPAEQRRHERLHSALSAAIEPARLASLMAQGAAWSADEADAVAFRREENASIANGTVAESEVV